MLPAIWGPPHHHAGPVPPILQAPSLPCPWEVSCEVGHSLVGKPGRRKGPKSSGATWRSWDVKAPPESQGHWLPSASLWTNRKGSEVGSSLPAVLALYSRAPVGAQPLSFACCGTAGRRLTLSQPQSPYLQMGNENPAPRTGLQTPEQCLAHHPRVIDLSHLSVRLIQRVNSFSGLDLSRSRGKR